jgi:hypothetical protein
MRAEQQRQARAPKLKFKNFAHVRLTPYFMLFIKPPDIRGDQPWPDRIRHICPQPALMTSSSSK